MKNVSLPPPFPSFFLCFFLFLFVFVCVCKYLRSFDCSVVLGLTFLFSLFCLYFLCFVCRKLETQPHLPILPSCLLLFWVYSPRSVCLCVSLFVESNRFYCTIVPPLLPFLPFPLLPFPFSFPISSFTNFILLFPHSLFYFSLFLVMYSF